jgi:hypothetical protein
MKRFHIMLLIMLTGIVSLTSCTSEMEQTPEENNKTIFHNQQTSAKEGECLVEEDCAKEAVRYFIEVDKTPNTTARCQVTDSQGGNGVYMGHVSCSNGYYLFYYENGFIKLVRLE